jgi:hypothetical protein
VIIKHDIYQLLPGSIIYLYCQKQPALPATEKSVNLWQKKATFSPRKRTNIPVVNIRYANN